MNSKIAALMPFVDFLGAALGSATEVVLHDLTEPENSVVKIVNGHVSGRNVGAPATDFARAIVREYGDSNINFVTDYVCKTVDGRPLQGSSYFIRDEGEVVGMICVNIDPQPFRSLEDALNVFMEAYRHGGSEEYRDANMASMGKTPSELDQAGRMEVVRKLEETGAFLIKGAAADVACELHVSVPSIYRYLQKVRREG